MHRTDFFLVPTTKYRRFSTFSVTQTITSLFLHFILSLVVVIIVIIRWRRSLDVEDIVASDQDLTQEARKLTVYIFFSSLHMNVHVTIHTGKHSLILHAPLQLNPNRLARQVCKEGFGVYNELGLYRQRRKETM